MSDPTQTQPLTRSSWGLVPAVVAFVKRQLVPNRITIWLTVFVNLTGALVTALGDLGVGQTAGVVTALVGINAVAAMFLKGWQQFEKAGYQFDLAMQGEAMERERLGLMQEQANAEAGKRRVSLPR